MWEFVINLLEVAILFLLFNNKLEKKELSYSYPLLILCLFSQAVLLLILKKFSCSTIFILLFFIGIHFIYGFLFFENKPITLLFWSVLYAIGTILADAVTTIVPTAFLDIDLSALLPNGMLRIPFTLIYISILFLFTLILLCINNQTFRLPFREKLAFILLSLLCIAILQAILIRQLTGYAPDQGNNDRFLSVIFFLVLFLFFAFVLYVYTLGTTQEQNQRLSEENIIQQMELKQYEQVVSSVEELRSIKHDMQNHMTVISAMLHEKQYEKACSYIDTYTDKLNQTHRIISSGNIPIDCIVTNKLSYAHAQHIKTTHSIFLPKDILIDDIQLCTLIGNLFDNAIEACTKIKEPDKRYIDFQIKPFNCMMSIYMENSCIGDYVIDKNGKLKTSKQTDIINHGIGLKRIEEIVERANGFVTLNPSNDKFEVIIQLPTEEH